MKNFIIITIYLLGISTSLFAADFPTDVRIDSVSAKGSGCPAGTARWAFAPNNSAISFLFDKYILQGSSASQYADCQFRFMIWYPKNYRLKIVGIDYRGAAVLPAGSSASVYTHILQQISRVARTIDENTTTLNGDYNDSFVLSRSTTKGDWIQCGGVAALNYIFTSKVQIRNNSGQESYFQIDSADSDFTGGFTMQLAWEKCR